MLFNLYVARDKDDKLFLYGFKPTRHYDKWYDWDNGDRTEIIELDENLPQFKHLTWNDEPVKVNLFDINTHIFVSNKQYSNVLKEN